MPLTESIHLRGCTCQSRGHFDVGDPVHGQPDHHDHAKDSTHLCDTMLSCGDQNRAGKPSGGDLPRDQEPRPTHLNDHPSDGVVFNQPDLHDVNHGESQVDQTQSSDHSHPDQDPLIPSQPVGGDQGVCPTKNRPLWIDLHRCDAVDWLVFEVPWFVHDMSIDSAELPVDLKPYPLLMGFPASNDHAAGAKACSSVFSLIRRPVNSLCTSLASFAKAGVLVFACLVVLGASLCSGQGQPENPVFVDDSTLATDILSGLPGLIESDNMAEAVRLLQELLDTQAQRLVADPNEPNLYTSVRSRVHRQLLGQARLLDRYRTIQTPIAQSLLQAGQTEQVARSYFLTKPGFEASLSLAGQDIAQARFASARLILAELEAHPESASQKLAGQALSLTAQLARYLNTTQTNELLARWASRAALPVPEITPIAWPKALVEPVFSPLSTGGEIDLDALVSMPMRTVELRPKLALEAPERQPISRRSTRDVVDYPYLFPVVVGDTIYTTDGLWVCAWDRFTLAKRWAVKPRGADLERKTLEEIYAAKIYRQRQSHDVEEATILGVSGRVLIVATGIVADGNRHGDPRVHALDRQTGRVLWSVYIDELAPELDESSSRGPALFEGDTVILTVRKTPQTKRFASVYLISLDLADGSLRWLRLAGSAGWLAYSGRGQWSDWSVLDEGVVYRVDELGVIAACKAGTGEPLWVRRAAGVESRMPMPRLPWAVSLPVIAGDRLLVLSPDRRDLLVIDKHTGKLLATRNADLLGKPMYMFAMGDQLVLVGKTRLATVLLTAPATAPVVLFPAVAEPGIIGRVVRAGTHLLMPTVRGLVAIDPADPSWSKTLALDARGNLLTLDNQLLVLGNDTLSSFLLWDQAARVLGDRLKANPDDVQTAVTFAELAYRANQPREALKPIDLAIAAINRDKQGSPAMAAHRQHLYELLIDMLNAALRDPSLKRSAAALDALSDRLEHIAVLPAQQAGYLLMHAQVSLASNRVDNAVADFQAILADDAKAGALWNQNGSQSDIQLRAGIEALSRLDWILTAYGSNVYEPVDRQASERLKALQSGKNDPADQTSSVADRFAALAMHFPRAHSTPMAWFEAARAYDAHANRLARDRALARGLESARRNHDLGIETPHEAISQLAGWSIASLMATGRLQSAWRVLTQVQNTWPDVALVSDAGPMDATQIHNLLLNATAGAHALPDLGTHPLPTVISLDGWALMRSLDRHSQYTTHTGQLLISADALGMWSVDQTTHLPHLLWKRDFAEKPVLIEHARDKVLLLETDDLGGHFVLLDAPTGNELWHSPSIGQTLAVAAGKATVVGPGRFRSPVDGSVDANDLLIALDEAEIVVMNRAGRAAAFDRLTGHAVWSIRTPTQAIHDIDADDGVLVYIGTSAPASKDQAGEPIVGMIDLANGELLSQFAARGSTVRWVNIVPNLHRAIVGLGSGIVALSIPNALPDWTMHDELLQETSGSWVVGDRLFVLTPANELGLIDASNGLMLVSQLESRGRLDRGGPIDLIEMNAQPTSSNPEQRVALLGPAGLAIFDPHDGTLMGVDAVEPFDRLVQPIDTHNSFVLFETSSQPGQPGVYRMTLVEKTSGRATEQLALMLDEPPRRAAAVDGAIFITFGDRTAVVAMPVDTRDQEHTAP